jgi:hypothetical protein
MLSKKALIYSIAGVTLLTSPVFAQSSTTGSQSPGTTNNSGAIGETKPNSVPGVRGPADTRTGPSTHAPEGSSTSGPSPGDAGADTSGNAGTTPSQDSSGVQGFPDTRTGPSTKSPDANSGTTGGAGSGQGSSKAP